MKVLLIGSGGREHALAWKLAQSPMLEALYAAPGNPGIADHAECVSLAVEDHKAVVDFCRLMGVTFVVIGPEAPLVAGLADDLRAAGIDCLRSLPPMPRPSSKAPRGSPRISAPASTFRPVPISASTTRPRPRPMCAAEGAPIVIKADGLAAGKGVTVAMTVDEALSAIDDCFEGAFGAAGAEVVVEAFLDGEEASFFCLSDGKTALALATAQDHKRVGDGDTGPNTGGMGAYSPAPVMTAGACRAHHGARSSSRPCAAWPRWGIPSQGVFFAGLMITDKGPELIEYNVRFGDPECQVLMMRLKSDLLPLLHAAATGTAVRGVGQLARRGGADRGHGRQRLSGCL